MKYALTALCLAFGLVVGAQADLDVLVATGQGVDFAVLSGNIMEVGGEAVNYAEVDHTAIDTQDLSSFDVLWLGWNASSHGGEYIRETDGDQIADFVSAGGVVLTAATDDDGWESMWLPANFDVLNTGDYDLAVTAAGQALFTMPNVVDGNSFVLDERYADIEAGFTILAWEPGKEDSEAGFAEIGRGDGLYVLTSLDNRNDGNGQLHIEIMENMIYYAYDFISNMVAVEPAGKLSLTWGQIKQ